MLNIVAQLPSRSWRFGFYPSSAQSMLYQQVCFRQGFCSVIIASLILCAAATGIPAKGTRKYRNYLKKQMLRQRKERQVARAQTLLRKVAACVKPILQQHRKQTAALEAENIKLKVKSKHVLQEEQSTWGNQEATRWAGKGHAKKHKEYIRKWPIEEL